MNVTRDPPPPPLLNLIEGAGLGRHSTDAANQSHLRDHVISEVAGLATLFGIHFGIGIDLHFHQSGNVVYKNGADLNLLINKTLYKNP